MFEDVNVEPRPHSFGPQEVDSLYLNVFPVLFLFLFHKNL